MTTKCKHTYKILTKHECDAFIARGGLKNLPYCYSCEDNVDVLWRWSATPEDGSDPIHVCIDCLDLHSGLKVNAYEFDFGKRITNKLLKVKYCPTCESKFVTCSDNKYCSSVCNPNFVIPKEDYA